jgi:hypothetical protein
MLVSPQDFVKSLPATVRARNKPHSATISIPLLSVLPIYSRNISHANLPKTNLTPVFFLLKIFSRGRTPKTFNRALVEPASVSFGLI